jgi:hypothetical protein
VKIVLKSNNLARDEVCAVCGIIFGAGDVLPYAFDDDADTRDRDAAIGHVCEECILTGPDEMRRRAGTDEIIDAPTPTDFEAAREELQRYREMSDERQRVDEKLEFLTRDSLVGIDVYGLDRQRGGAGNADKPLRR